MKADKIPPRPGYVVTAAVWQFDGRKMRLRQVCYEERGRRKPEAEPGQSRVRRGAVATERPADQQGNLGL